MVYDAKGTNVSVPYEALFELALLESRSWNHTGLENSLNSLPCLLKELLIGQLVVIFDELFSILVR